MSPSLSSNLNPPIQLPLSRQGVWLNLEPTVTMPRLMANSMHLSLLSLLSFSSPTHIHTHTTTDHSTCRCFILQLCCSLCGEQQPWCQDPVHITHLRGIHVMLWFCCWLQPSPSPLSSSLLFLLLLSLSFFLTSCSLPLLLFSFAGVGQRARWRSLVQGPSRVGDFGLGRRSCKGLGSRFGSDSLCAKADQLFFP